MLLLALLGILLYKKKITALIGIASVMILVRVLFNVSVLPERQAKYKASKEKDEALAISSIVEDEPLFLYYSNIHLNMAWYISQDRMQVLGIKDEDDKFYTSDFYLIPSDVISDQVEYKSYFNFVRNYEQKPFQLIKYLELPTSQK